MGRDGGAPRDSTPNLKLGVSIVNSIMPKAADYVVLDASPRLSESFHPGDLNLNQLVPPIVKRPRECAHPGKYPI